MKLLKGRCVFAQVYYKLLKPNSTLINFCPGFSTTLSSSKRNGLPGIALSRWKYDHFHVLGKDMDYISVPLRILIWRESRKWRIGYVLQSILPRVEFGGHHVVHSVAWRRSVIAKSKSGSCCNQSVASVDLVGLNFFWLCEMCKFFIIIKCLQFPRNNKKV